MAAPTTKCRSSKHPCQRRAVHTWALVYYREEWNGRVLIEIDILNMVFIVDGVDRLAEQRAAIL